MAIKYRKQSPRIGSGLSKIQINIPQLYGRHSRSKNRKNINKRIDNDVSQNQDDILSRNRNNSTKMVD